MLPRRSGWVAIATLPDMATFVFRLMAPRPTFALDMTDEEREIMASHAAYWRPFVDSGQMVIFGPVLDSSGSWGLGVLEAEDEDELRSFAATDPAVTSGTASLELGKMLAGFVRPLGARNSDPVGDRGPRTDPTPDGPALGHSERRGARARSAAPVQGRSLPPGKPGIDGACAGGLSL